MVQKYVHFARLGKKAVPVTTEIPVLAEQLTLHTGGVALGGLLSNRASPFIKISGELIYNLKNHKKYLTLYPYLRLKQFHVKALFL